MVELKGKFLSLPTIFKYLDATLNSRCFIEGEQILNSQHLILCGRKNTDYNINVVSLCLQTSALQTHPHKINGELK